jgi:BirA family biotin operon repressor/biotin-[acetyl-CoA-carboxylase] ligase
MSSRLNLSNLQHSLETRVIGKAVFFLKEVNSTNSWAKQLARSGAREGTIAVAETQASGRGRLDRRWYSPVGGLWFSVILRPKIYASQVSQLTVMTGLSVIQTLHDLYNLEAHAKWPNDVLVNGRKICGILGEANSEADRVSFVVIGVGLNANFNVHKALPESIAAGATSLQTEIGHKVRLERLLITLLKRFEGNYGVYLNKDFSCILAEWKKHANFIGHEVNVVDHEGVFIGIAENVDANGALLVKLEDGTMKSFLAADVSLRPKQRQK